MKALCISLATAAVIAVALAHHFATVSGLEGDVKTLEGAKAQLQAANLILTAENKTCAASVETQNAALAEMVKEGEARAATARAAILDAERRAKHFEGKAADLMRNPMPIPGDECASLEKIINDEIGGRILSGRQ